MIRVLSKQSPLHREGALLSRFVYKYENKFRNDIGYRYIRKSYSSLRKYKEINLLKDVENFTAVLPGEDDEFAPTRQMLEYVLSRIITFSKLMVRIYISSKQAAIFYMDRVKRGESHWMSLIPYALVSRIWSMSGILLHHATSWYFCLHPYLDILQPKGLEFLPRDYELPKDLFVWLDLKNLDNFGKFDWSEKRTIQVVLGFDDQETDSFENFLEYASNINEENMDTEIENSTFGQKLKSNTELIGQLHTSNIAKMDHGQAISRESYKALSSLSQDHEHIPMQGVPNLGKPAKESCKVLSDFQKKLTNENKSNHYFGKITNVNSLKQFLEKEETFRNDGSNQSLTKHLSFMQWLTLKTSLLKIGDTVLNNKKIEKKLSKVWKEKCLDYA